VNLGLCKNVAYGIATTLGILPLFMALAGVMLGQDASPAATGNVSTSPNVVGGSRSYVPSLFGAQPIAIDQWQPLVPGNEPAPAVGIVDNSAQDSGMIEPWAPYVRNPAQQYLLYGVTASASFEHDGASPGIPADSLWMAVLQPYVGLMGRTRTGFFVLQYAPSIVPYNTQTAGSTAYHTVAFDAAADVTPRLKWNFDVRSGYGAEMGRLTGNLDAQRITSGVPMADISYASLQPFGGNSLDAGVQAGVTYQLTRRDTLGVMLGEAYSTFLFDPGIQQPKFRSNAVWAGLSFDRAVSEKVALRAYGTETRVFSNVLPCSSFSGGLGMILQPVRSVSVDVGAGPSSGCGAQAANFHATISQSLLNRLSLYAGGARQLNTLYRLNSRWEDDVFAGFSRHFRRAEVGVDAGYYHGQALELPAPSQGYFMSPRLNYGLSLSRFTSIGFSYRRFHESGLGGGRDISFAMVSVSVSPSPLGLKR
jgi:hypothetical protein